MQVTNVFNIEGRGNQVAIDQHIHQTEQRGQQTFNPVILLLLGAMYLTARGLIGTKRAITERPVVRKGLARGGLAIGTALLLSGCSVTTPSMNFSAQKVEDKSAYIEPVPVDGTLSSPESWTDVTAEQLAQNPEDVIDCDRLSIRADGKVAFQHDGPLGMASHLEIRMWRQLTPDQRIDLANSCADA